ncbi:LacI family DNA-binding transcriptional regulator [Peribacillus sp. NPDC096379]|uniref:LacI family DNA-binding transcriptional regulator n=1 Tax=Peribacillus sp. NPDC096379 TaxID=3364393 RepID=UPI00382A3C06
MKVTAKMIAEALGVSTATVDRVLNNRNGVREKTIKRVKEKAVELGYKPNTAAKFLATQKKTEIAFILPVVPDYFWNEIEMEIKQAAKVYEDFGLSVHIHRIHTFPKGSQINYIKKIIDENLYDALVISPHDAEPYINVINEGVKKGIPIFTLNNDVPQSKRILYVGGDYYQAGFLAAELIHLFSKKLNDVVIIKEDEDFFQMTNKEKGFRDYFNNNSIGAKIHVHTISSTNVMNSLSEEWEKRTLYATDAIYVANGILGDVAEFLYENNKEDYKLLIGHDMSEKVYKFLHNNVIKSVICQDPASQAMITVKQVFEYIVLGEQNEKSEIIIKLEIVTKANSKYFINF